jgi:DNA-binding response OmpR family regulator
MTSMRPERILVVDDEDRLRSTVVGYLRREGYQVDEAATGEEAVEKVRSKPPDLVLLDVRLPGIDGFEVLQKLRRSSDVYVIMLTARTDETDRLIGLEGGADDYVTKPFSPRELVARVRAVLRRKSPVPATDVEVFRFPGIAIDQARRQLTVEDRPVEVTALEFDLLSALAESPGRVFTRRQLIERIWGWDFFGDERLVDTHISNLRKALGDSPEQPRYIGTVRGIGYKFIGDSS